MNLANILKSKIFLAIAAGILALGVLVFTFAAGVAVGFRKAQFSYAWGDNYQHNFAGPRGGFLRNAVGRDFIDAHGTFGQIIKVDGPILVIRGRDNIEKIIITDEDTAVRGLGNMHAVDDIGLDDQIIVIGEPTSQGQIHAKFIRIAPPLGGGKMHQ